MPWQPDVPHNALPPLPPEELQLETRPVLKATIAARSALAALDQAVHLIPNPWVLLNAASLLEAQASSEIENIVTTEDRLFRYADDQSGGDQATKEALRYRSALLEGVEATRNRPLTFGTCERVCSRIKDREMSVRNLPGTRVANPATGQIIYAPPEGESEIRGKLASWESFIHAEDELDPLVRMAAAHYQFEAIHPFHDGNGRTGRILNILILVNAGLISLPVLYLSRFIIRHKGDYYRLLGEVTSTGAWEPWILYMLRAVEETAASTLVKIGSIREVQEEIQQAARAALRVGGRNTDLLSVLFEQPYSRVANVMARCEVSRPTATNWLNTLVDAHILTSHRVGRERLYVNQRFLDVLTRDEIRERPAPETQPLF